jgi:dihydrofolate reductase
MTANKLTVTIHAAASLDGMIAKKDNSVSWFETASYYDKGVDAPDAASFVNPIDCYVMGANTYLHALELSTLYGWPYGEVPTIVVTSRNLPINKPNIQLFSGSLQALVNEKLAPGYKNVWVVGGAMLAQGFINANLADEIRLSVLPIVLGEGLPLFNPLQQEVALHLKEVTAYKTGMVELWYEVKK